jgi:hypothetical protein
MKVRKSAVTLWVLVLLGTITVSGCGLVTVETPVPTPDIAATVEAAVAVALASQPTPDLAATVKAAVATEVAATQAAQAEPTVEPTPTEEPTPEPTKKPTVEPTEEPTPEPTEEPTVEPTEEPTPVPPTATRVPLQVEVTGIICKPYANSIDMEGKKVFLAPEHFGRFGYDHSGFEVTVVNPLTGNQIEAVKIIAFRDANDTRIHTWYECDYALKKSMREALDGREDGDLDRMANRPLKEREPLTLIFISAVPTQD